MSCLFATCVVLLAGLVLPHAAAAQDIVGLKLLPLDGKPKIGVILDNPTQLPVWVLVSIDVTESVTCGSGKNQLAAGQRMMVVCPVAELLAKQNYPITAVFDADEDATNHIATRQRKGRFSKRDVKWLNSQLVQQP